VVWLTAKFFITLEKKERRKGQRGKSSEAKQIGRHCALGKIQREEAAAVLEEANRSCSKITPIRSRVNQKLLRGMI